MARPRIYQLLSNRPWLKPDNGDAVTELKLMKALSSFADVYYNDSKVDFSRSDLGMNQKEVGIPGNDYSLYYVRNNIDIFREISGPKLWLGVPYNEEAYETADAVVTYTSAWKDMLENYNDHPEYQQYFENVYPEKIIEPRKVINLGQFVDDSFRRQGRPGKVREYKMKFGSGFVLAFMGRIDEQTIPRDFIDKMTTLKRLIPDISVVFGGKISADIKSRHILQTGFIPYLDMPEVIDACDLMMTGTTIQSEWDGSGKILDAIVRQKPIVTRKSSARVEELGKSYPMFFDSVDEMINKIHKFYAESEFQTEVKDYMKGLLIEYSTDHMLVELQEKLIPTMKQSN